MLDCYFPLPIPVANRKNGPILFNHSLYFMRQMLVARKIYTFKTIYYSHLRYNNYFYKTTFVVFNCIVIYQDDLHKGRRQILSSIQAFYFPIFLFLYISYLLSKFIFILIVLQFAQSASTVNTNHFTT